MYRNMDEWLEIRRRVLIEGVSRRQICRETGMHWQTLEKILTFSSPPGYRRTAPVAKPKIGPFLERIAQILKADKQLPRNQRHTAVVIWRELAKEGFTGSYTIVKDAVRKIEAMGQEVFMPLVHRPGEAQVDFRLDGREHLRGVKVAPCDIRAYTELLGGSKAMAAVCDGGEA